MAMPPMQKLLYFCAVPVLIGLYFGWFKADQGGQDLMVRTVLVPYWIGFFLLGWFAVIVAAIAGHQLMKPWCPPLWLISILGPAALSWLGAYIINAYIEFLNSLMPEVIGKSRPLEMNLSLDFLLNFLSFMAPNLALFTAQNYYFNSALKQPIYRYQFTGTQSLDTGASFSEDIEANLDRKTVPASNPTFVKLLAKENQGDLVAVQAQEHFIKVWTDSGNELIRYKFGTALLELEQQQGMQIHRSYWVVDDAVKQLKKDGAKYFIELNKR